METECGKKLSEKLPDSTQGENENRNGNEEWREQKGDQQKTRRDTKGRIPASGSTWAPPLTTHTNKHFYLCEDTPSPLTVATQCMTRVFTPDKMNSDLSPKTTCYPSSTYTVEHSRGAWLVRIQPRPQHQTRSPASPANLCLPPVQQISCITVTLLVVHVFIQPSA